VKVVRIIGSRFWVWGGGEDSDGVMVLWGGGEDSDGVILLWGL
jgi:hypothetical protein